MLRPAGVSRISEIGIGLAYILGPTGGYLLGYLPAAALAGWAGTRDWASKPLTPSAAGLWQLQLLVRRSLP
ncbi:biotin transporter BioY [Mesorhizobium sp. M0019]|uniref:biotin transporter BioY n=1 Tax=Mesorhizobium sp. M0019 TaxID=2956845 RepID=UPI00333B4BFF